MTLRFVVVAEDQLGYRLVRDLGDRVIMERGASWLRDLWCEEELRSSQRSWTGFEPGQAWSSWGDIKRLGEELSVRGHGLGIKAEAAMARKAVAIAAELPTKRPGSPSVDALFLVHDTDGDEAVRDRLREGGRGRDQPAFTVLVAAPHPESEVWVIAGAAPNEAEAKELHAAERQRLGFDPVRYPEGLTSNRATDKRDAKRVCEALLGPPGKQYERWERCWRETPLDELEQNGAAAGLRHYTQELEDRMLPLLGGPGSG
ncbi:MAG TPA: hypothetical protein VLS89_19400 [Candidatus Nanopelagicales bacterium]|nr:hypothetical protein [Candidatus Nanopelagicales bacterium]